MTDLNIELLPWQQDVWADDTRFKIVAAGRRTGKSRLAAWMLIVNALQADRGHVFYVAPTQGQARDIMWQTLLELGHPVIACLLYTSPSPRDGLLSRMPSSA